MSELTPKYTFWEGLNVAIQLGQRALEEIRALARLPGPAGKDGKDGVSARDITVECSEDGVFLCIMRENIKERTRLPIPMDRGVYRSDKSYCAGDGVTWGGSFWIAQKETSEKPGENGSWRLAVKKGRDGKDAETPRGPVGPVKVG